MSYLTPHPLSGVVDVALAAKSVVEDPCLFDTATLLLRLNELEGGSGGSSVTTPVKGIGLCKATPYLRKVVWVREHPVASAAIGVGIVGGLLAGMYLLGKKSRGRR